MPSFRCIGPDSQDRRVPFAAGETLLRALTRARIQGVHADCGGGGACATCHVYLDPQWTHLSSSDDRERDMLSFCLDPRPTSRLACRVRLTDDCDGGLVQVAARQR